MHNGHVNVAITMNKLHTGEFRLEQPFKDNKLITAHYLNRIYECPEHSSIWRKMPGGEFNTVIASKWGASREAAKRARSFSASVLPSFDEL
jgi:hypothetical protein